jgi:hypothetical protein
MFVSFFGWLGICLLLQAASYYQNYTFKDRLPRASTIDLFSQAEIDHRASLFDETVKGGNYIETHNIRLNTPAEGDEEDEDSDGDGLGEPSMTGRRTRFRKEFMNDAELSFFYHTGT